MNIADLILAQIRACRGGFENGVTLTADWDSVGLLRRFQKVSEHIQPENQNPKRPNRHDRGYPSPPPGVLQPARNRVRVARAECARMECRVRM